jgi:hypothetical protein
MKKTTEISPPRRSERVPTIAVLAWLTALLVVGCAHTGRLTTTTQTLTPVDTTGGHHPERAERPTPGVHPMFGPDTLIGFQPGTGDSSRRYLGRLRHGLTADTLNIVLLGDNRPSFRSSRLEPDLLTIEQGLSPNPVKIGKAVITIPIAFFKGMYPDLGLVRDIPAAVTKNPTYGREHQVLNAVLAKIDTLNSHHKMVAAVINTGDLVYDGRRPAHWERFLRITEPLSSRVPYFAVAGNHEQTWTEEGVDNWRAATGLPVGGDRLYYCFDSADGWVRFIALDTNPITEPGVHWSRDLQLKYSKEEVDWLSKRIKEHTGPAFVFMHSPPFSAGYHRTDWQDDPVMRARRDQIVQALHQSGISALVAGHEHDYERALLTWPDGSVLITIVQGGGGAPLHPLPPPAEANALFTEYKSAGSTIKSQNVFTEMVNNFTFMRLWYGGGELQTFAVEKDGSAKLIDHVAIDLRRYHQPKIVQKKVRVAPTARVQPSTMEAKAAKGIPMKGDTTAASRKLETQPPPGKKPRRKSGP